MADLAVKKTSRPTAPTATPDLFRAFRDLMRWDPFREVAPLAVTDHMTELDAPFEVKETKEGYVFKADVPGIKENDMSINLTDSRLTVSGKREEEKKQESDTYFSMERSYGTFVRSFTLPEGIDADKVSANLKDGVLTISVPKKPGTQPKQISVKTG